MSALNRTPDGIIQTCCECSRPFKGHAWQDYCAECHAENERTSPLHNRWACLTCNTTFELGKVRSGPQGWMCPNCRSTDLSPAHGSRELDRYDGPIPGQKQ
jgi:hypothetical protein